MVRVFTIVAYTVMFLMLPVQGIACEKMSAGSVQDEPTSVIASHQMHADGKQDMPGCEKMLKQQSASDCMLKCSACATPVACLPDINLASNIIITFENPVLIDAVFPPHSLKLLRPPIG